jgi:hypothetical protein
MALQHPTGWFDQFPPTPEGWTHDQWCWRHWAPCPVFGGNGMGAAVEVMTEVVKLMPADATPEGRNQWMVDAGKLCCTLGDERMYEIWGHWPPVGPAPEGDGSDG